MTQPDSATINHEGLRGTASSTDSHAGTGQALRLTDKTWWPVSPTLDTMGIKEGPLHSQEQQHVRCFMQGNSGLFAATALPPPIHTQRVACSMCQLAWLIAVRSTPHLSDGGSTCRVLSRSLKG